MDEARAARERLQKEGAITELMVLAGKPSDVCEQALDEIAAAFGIYWGTAFNLLKAGLVIGVPLHRFRRLWD
jgi:hypothetical protein